MASKNSTTSIRAVFGQNLRQLCAPYSSISEVCRQLGINRTQFNRYLNGESYPRPDLLARFCGFFGTDARIFTQPLEEISSASNDIFNHPEIRDFTDIENTKVSEDLLPSGFYRFTRQSFLHPECCVIALVYVYRRDGWTFLKGSEARQSLKEQGLPFDPQTRQFRGVLQKVEGGVSATVSRRGALTYTFSYITPVASFDRNFWQGYSARTINESHTTTRVARLAYEYLGKSTKLILETARTAGMCEIENLPPYHKHLLRIGEPFA